MCDNYYMYNTCMYNTDAAVANCNHRSEDMIVLAGRENVLLTACVRPGFTSCRKHKPGLSWPGRIYPLPPPHPPPLHLSVSDSSLRVLGSARISSDKWAILRILPEFWRSLYITIHHISSCGSNGASVG